MKTMLRCLCLAMVSTIALGDMNMDICSTVKTSCGPVPPVLPTSFILKGSKLDVNSKELFWFEEYFDPDNLRAKYVEVIRGVENHMIFDYYYQQIISYLKIHPGADRSKDPVESLSCLVQDMDDSSFTSLVGKKSGHFDNLRSRMYNAYESLRYGGQYSYAYNKSTSFDDIRNVPCMVFQGCVYDENVDGTYDMNFVWTTEDVAVAFNTYPTIMRIQERGGYYTTKAGSDPVWNPQQYDKNIAWFEANPYLPEELFFPPVRMECQDMHSGGSVALPTMPPYFSTRMESFITTEDWKGNMIRLTQDTYQELWYDSGNNLIRHDHLPSLFEEFAIFEVFDSLALVTAVHDFNSGLSFYSDKIQGACISVPIIYMPDSLILSSKSATGAVVMASPAEILGIDETLTYKGKYRVRDMDCKGYSGRVNNTSGDDKKPATLLREIYVSSEGWHEEVDGETNFEIPLRDIQAFAAIENGQQAEVIVETNYYKFRPSRPAFSVYDISGCAAEMPKKFFQVDLKAVKKPEGMDDQKVLDLYYELFINSAQQNLAERAFVGSLLRIQDLKVEFQASGPAKLKFTILEKFDKQGSVSSPQRGNSLDEAVNTLTTDINTGIASIKFITDSMEKDVVEYLLVPKSLDEIKKVTILENLSTLPQTTRNEDFSMNSKTAVTERLSTESIKKVRTVYENGGYSDGAVAGLAIAMLIVGLGIGVAAMMFYFKKYMRLRGRNDMETADFGLSERST